MPYTSQNPNKKKKTINKEHLTNRVPRPLGLTLQLRTINKQENNGEELRRIKIALIEQWTSGNMMLNEKIYTVEQMSSYLNMSIAEINKYMWKAMGKIGKLLEKKEAGEIARDLFGWGLKKNMEIHALLAYQAKLMLGSQHDEYKPFISQTVNQALSNLNASQASTLGLIKVLTDKHDTNIIINQNMQSTNQSLTIESAMKLLSVDQNGIEESEESINQKALSFSPFPTIPDTNPRTQDIRFLTTPKVEKSADSHINPLPIKVQKGTSDGIHQGTKHENRRQQSEQILDDLDEEDFRI